MPGYTNVSSPTFKFDERWSTVERMLLELLTTTGLQASYRPLRSSNLSVIDRWLRVNKMLTALYGEVLNVSNRTRVSSIFYRPSVRWAQVDQMFLDLFSQIGNPTSLSALTLAANTVAENTGAGAVVGGILGRTVGSTLSLPGTGGGKFAISGTNIVTTSSPTNYEAATSHQITIRETLVGAINTPRDSVLTINVTNVNEQPNLSALTFSNATHTIGSTASGSINGATAGSTITASGLPTGLTINGPARTWAYNGGGSAAVSSVTLTETLADSANSPRQSILSVTIQEAGSFSLDANPAPSVPPASWSNASPGSWSDYVNVGDPEQLVEFTVGGGGDAFWCATRNGGSGSSGLGLCIDTDTLCYISLNGQYSRYPTSDGNSFTVASIAAGTSFAFGVDPVSGDLIVRQAGVERKRISAASLAANASSVAANTHAFVYFPAGEFNSARIGPYYGTVDPMEITDETIAPNGRVTLDIAYYMPADDNVQIEVKFGATTILAAANATVTENAVAGIATIESVGLIPGAYRGGPVTIIATQVATPANTDSVQEIWSAPMSYGTNPVPTTDYYLTAPTANHLSYWRVAQGSGDVFNPFDHPTAPQLTRKGHPTQAAAAGTTPSAFCIPPKTNGQRMRFRWNGTATGSINTSGRQCTADNQTTGSGGGWTWIDFDYNYNMNHLLLGNDQTLVCPWMNITPTGTGGAWPTEIQCVEIDGSGNLISSGFWNARWITEMQLYASQPGFPLRAMDLQNMSGNSYNPIVLTQAGDTALTTRYSIPDLLDMYAAIGVNAWLHIAWKTPEAVVRAEAVRMATWAVAQNKRVRVELANEIWNPGQGAWNNARLEGIAAGYSGTDNDKVLRRWSFRHKQVMTWVTEEFVALGALARLDRVIGAQNDNVANVAQVVYGETGCVDYIDTIATAPYLAGGKGVPSLYNSGSGTWDFETYADRIREDIPIVHHRAMLNRDYAFSIGKNYDTYEGGLEDSLDTGMDLRFRHLPLFGTIVGEILDDWETRVGGPYKWYSDFRRDRYGISAFIGQPLTSSDPLIPPAYGYVVWRDRIL